MGRYVDALSTDVAYQATFPNKMDFRFAISNPRAPDDPDYDPTDVLTEKIYLYVLPTVTVHDSEEKEGGRSVTIKTKTVSYEWTSTGQRDFTKAYKTAEDDDKADCIKRDQVISKLMKRLSPDSKTLLKNTNGYKEALAANNLWLIIKKFLPESHNQVSTSTVQKRTRAFLSSVQDCALHSFTETFSRDYEQFRNDWESAKHPGYIEIDPLVCNTFIQAIRQGVDHALLHPAIESLSLNTKSHRHASLQTAKDTIMSYYIRNKSADSVETSISGFQAMVKADALLCDSCKCKPCLSDHAMKNATSRFSPQDAAAYFNRKTSVPRFCGTCVANPPPCSCGKRRLHAWYSSCTDCFKVRRLKSKKLVKDTKSDTPLRDSKAHVAEFNSNLSTPSTNNLQLHPLSIQPSASQHLPQHPYPLQQYNSSFAPHLPTNNGYYYPPVATGSTNHFTPQGFNATGFHHAPVYHSPAPSSYSHDDDSVSDYSNSTYRPHGHLADFDWTNFDSSPAGLQLKSLLQEVPPICWNAALGLDQTMGQHTYYIDSGASMHLTDDLSHLTNVRCLSTPIPLSGINKSKIISLTHVGNLPWMPPGMQQCFFGPGLGARLISLNYMCSNKRTQYYNVPDAMSMVLLVDGCHFVTCRQTTNNLLPLPKSGPGPFFPFPTISNAPVAHSAIPLAIRQYTKEQISRCDQVEELLDLFCRPSDECLALSIQYGSLGKLGVGLTPADVHRNRLLRGPDRFRIQGRIRDPPAVASQSQPAPSPCWTLVVDQHIMKFADIFGNTCKLYVVDEFSGAFWVIVAKSGSGRHLHESLMKFIHTTCNAYGHRVRTIHADADSVFNSLVAQFGSVTIKIQLAPPGHHAKRIERYTQTFNERRRMLEASLLFKIPEELGLSVFMDMCVASSMRSLINTVSQPNTPDEIIYRERSQINNLTVCKYQQVVSVKMGEAKRAALAAMHMVNIQRIPLTEIAICLGPADHPHRATYYFYLRSTNKVVVRRFFTKLHHIIPDFCRVNPLYSRILDPSKALTEIIYPSEQLQGTPLQLAPEVAITQRIPVPHVNLDANLPEESSNAIPVTTVLPKVPLVRYVDTPTLTPLFPNTTPPTTLNAPSPPIPRIPSTESPATNSIVFDPPTTSSTVLVPPVTNSIITAPPATVSAITPALDMHSTTVNPAPLQSVSTLQAPVVVVKNLPTVSPPLNAGHQRSTKGQNRHLHFDNSYSPSQRARKAALIAQRAHSQHRFSEATWADILVPEVSSVHPSVQQSAFFTNSHRPTKTGVPIHASLRAGSRGTPIRHRVKPQPAFIPQVFRQICFLALMQQAVCAMPNPLLTNSNCPTWSAFAASPLLSTDFASSSLQFTPKDNKEMTYRQGVKTMPPDELRAAVAIELTKLFDTHKAIRPVLPSAIRPDAVRIYSSMLVKTKYFADGTYDRVSARFAAGGNTQPEGSYGDTYAPTADESSGLCAFASFAAHAVQNQYSHQLQYSNFDVKGAFLWVPRDTSIQIIMRLPSYIDHPLAGCDVEVLKSIYGLKDSNANFDVDFRKQIIKAGFKSTVDPCIYIKMSPNPSNPKVPHRCIVSTHVDDGRAMYNHRPFYEDLIRTLESRYGPLSKDEHTSSYTGTTFSTASDGAFNITQEGYVQRLIASTNLQNLPVRSTPSDDDLFSDTSHMPLCDATTFRQLIGSLIHLLRTRYDIQKEVVFLSSKMSKPTVGDMSKGIKVLQYLKGTPSLGPRYYTTEGPVLYVYVDASYAVHHDGRSQTGCSFHIGRNSAPFYVKAGKQTECVSIGSMEAEYVALSQAARKLLEFRYLMEDIGFPQLQPTVIYEDNMSAINLAVSPHITRKSRHIHTRHHFIRDLISQKLAVVRHLATEDMLADFFTKPYGPKHFRLSRNRLFNTS